MSNLVFQKTYDELAGNQQPEIDNFYRVDKGQNQLDIAIKEADALVNQRRRNGSYITECQIVRWRNTGMLDETSPGSWEETTLACMLENQRCIQECAWADNRTIEDCK